MVRDEGIDEGINVDKSQRGKQRSAEKQRGREQSATTEKPQANSRSERRDRKKVLPARSGIDLPAGINKNQVGRPKQFPEVKPDDATRDQHALHPGKCVA